MASSEGVASFQKRLTESHGLSARRAAEPRSTAEPIQALRSYLEKEGARLYDETRDMDVTLEFYGSGDHVAPGMMAGYTEMFWKKVGKLVKAEPAR